MSDLAEMISQALSSCGHELDSITMQKIKKTVEKEMITTAVAMTGRAKVEARVNAFRGKMKQQASQLGGKVEGVGKQVSAVSLGNWADALTEKIHTEASRLK